MLGRFGGTPLVSVMERSPWNCEVDLPGGERRLCSLVEKLVRRLRAERWKADLKDSLLVKETTLGWGKDKSGWWL